MRSVGFGYVPWPVGGLGAEGETQAPTSGGGGGGGGGGGFDTSWIGPASAGVTNLAAGLVSAFRPGGGAAPPGTVAPPPSSFPWIPVALIAGVGIVGYVLLKKKSK